VEHRQTILACPCLTRQDAAVTESDDVAERGRAIFQRLRQEGTDGAGESQAEGEPTSPDIDDAVVISAGSPAVDATPAAEPARNPLPGAADLPPLDAIGAAEEVSAAASPLHAAAPADAPPSMDAPTEVEAAPGPDLQPADSAVRAEPAPAAALADQPDQPDQAAEASVEPPPETATEERPVSHFARPLPRVMAVANQKGGVGKTTTAVNLGACLADIGYRVLVVDLDPQGNASTGLGINIRDLQGSMYDVILHDLPIEDCVEATSVRNLFCAPSSLDLAGAEIELVPAFSRELRLRRALEEVHDDYDFVLIDCPPSLGLLTVNGLAAATEVVVPIQCEYYALEGLGQLLRNVNLVQRNLNPGLELSAIILVMYDARTKLADQVVSEVREHFGPKVCRNVVPRTVRLSEAPSFGQPIIAFDSSSRGAIAYRELAKEVSGGTPQRAR
jgi:chromosome partitioning protein